jgi:hypothetical protein
VWTSGENLALGVDLTDHHMRFGPVPDLELAETSGTPAEVGGRASGADAAGRDDAAG